MNDSTSVPQPPGWISHDDKPLPNICDCRFTDSAGEPAGEGWHYDRKCRFCGHQWRGLHCPHDGYQNPCPNCGRTPDVVADEGVAVMDGTANGHPTELSK